MKVPEWLNRLIEKDPLPSQVHYPDGILVSLKGGEAWAWVSREDYEANNNSVHYTAMKEAVVPGWMITAKTFVRLEEGA